MWAIPTGTSSALKKKTGKESQYMVSHPELGLDPPIGSDRESGRDRYDNPAKVLITDNLMAVKLIHVKNDINTQYAYHPKVHHKQNH